MAAGNFPDAICSEGQPLLPALLGHLKISLVLLCQCQTERLLQILVQLVEVAKSSGDVDPGERSLSLNISSSNI